MGKLLTNWYRCKNCKRTTTKDELLNLIDEAIKKKRMAECPRCGSNLAYYEELKH